MKSLINSNLMFIIVPLVLFSLITTAENKNTTIENNPTEIIHSCLKQRLIKDIQTVQEIVQTLPKKYKQRQYNKQLDEIRKEVDSWPKQYGPDFKTIFPINHTHEKIFHIIGKIWEDRGIKRTIIWTCDPYQYLQHLPQKPGPSDKNDSLSLEMMGKETRSVAFNIASPKNTDVLISIIGLPDEARKKHIEIRKVLWTDTKKLEPVASALLPLNEENSVYKLSITGGLIQQIWITVHSKDLAPNTYNLTK